MTYLWSKNPGEEHSSQSVQQFMSGDDLVLDQELLRYDVAATRAHAAGLQRIEIITSDELADIHASLDDLIQSFDQGEFLLQPPFEDGHSAIESWLVERLGAVGEKVHTGRSRNDQVQVAMRLYLRDQLFQLELRCLELAERFLDRARQDEFTPMPGYTHLQRAVPSSIGLWLGSFAESYLDIAELTGQTRQWINSCPLGTAAGYGVNLELDRDFVAGQLEFDRLQLNPMYVQNSRGRFELQALMGLAQATLELRRFAWDLSLYASQEFEFVRLASDFKTGSSIMPNKSNPDFVELIRAQHAVVQGAIGELQSVLSLPSGYHRDLQLTKPPVIRAFKNSLTALALTADLVRTMQFHPENMRNAIDADLYATDVAIEKVSQRGVPFREAYRQPVTKQQLAGRQPEDSLKQRRSLGACGNLGLEAIDARLQRRKQSFDV